MSRVSAPVEEGIPLHQGSLVERVLDALVDAGAATAGVAAVDELSRARSVIEARRDAGLNDQMSFTFRNPTRSTDPRSALPSARSAVVAAFPYDSSRAPAPRPLMAEVARYAAGDTYGDLRNALDAGAEILRSEGHRAVVLADDNALVDRAMAERAGLGWTGKNTNLLVPGVGSWVVLGSILTDVVLEQLPARREAEIERGCGNCSRCLGGCPTGALVAPGAMDASRCLSWLLQRTGSFPRRYRVALGTRIYGCDDCQAVCPPSIVRSGTLPPMGVAGEVPGSHVEISELLTLDDQALLERFGAWYIPRRDPRYLRRNALVVLGNAAALERSSALRGPGDPDEVVGMLTTYLGDEDPLLVEHASWAARRAGVDHLLADGPWATHPEVLAEMSRPHPVVEDTLADSPGSRETAIDGPGRR